jgi:hypothetical protein
MARRAVMTTLERMARRAVMMTLERMAKRAVMMTLERTARRAVMMTLERTARRAVMMTLERVARRAVMIIACQHQHQFLDPPQLARRVVKTTTRLLARTEKGILMTGAKMEKVARPEQTLVGRK